MKRILKIILSLLIFFILIIGGLSYYVEKNVIKHPFKSSISGDIKVEVKSGDNLTSIIDNLNKSNMLNNAELTKLYIKLFGDNPKIDIGKYSVASNIDIYGLINSFSDAKKIKEEIKVTIPEGFNIEEIGNLLQSKSIISKDEFIKSCINYKLPSYIKSDSKRKFSLEGFLFPDTYEFKKNTSGEYIISTMLKRFEDVIKEIETKNNINLLNSELDSKIIMASIVEGEIKSSDERSLASSVFYNRMNINMKLQSCATVQYALGYHKEKLYDKDIKIQSPYNTYIVTGLPIGPICSPGKASIEAALFPKETKYLYFLSKNDGTHYFTDSYNDFVAAKKKYIGGD